MIDFDLSGLTVRMTGLPAARERRLAEEWAPFAAPPTARPWLDVRIDVVAGGSRPRGADAKSMTGGVVDGAAKWAMIGAGAHVPRDGPVEIRIEDAAAEFSLFAVINLMHAAIAWRLPAIGGLMLHAAAAVVDGRAFVLVGAEASGKTTWSRLARAAGARVLSDDIVLVAPSAGGFEALGSPLRAKDFGGGAPGRWPVAAILLPSHGAAAALEPASALRAQAALTANLPFVSDDPGRLVEAGTVVGRLAGTVPARTLVFTREDGGFDLLRAV